jgi:hypothetical protein
MPTSKENKLDAAKSQAKGAREAYHPAPPRWGPMVPPPLNPAGLFPAAGFLQARSAVEPVIAIVSHATSGWAAGRLKTCLPACWLSCLASLSPLTNQRTFVATVLLLPQRSAADLESPPSFSRSAEIPHPPTAMVVAGLGGHMRRTSRST